MLDSTWWTRGHWTLNIPFEMNFMRMLRIDSEQTRGEKFNICGKVKQMSQKKHNINVEY